MNMATQNLFDAAKQLGDKFSARSAEFEKARCLPKDVSNAMAAAGFYRMYVPEEIGGLETSPADSARVFERLAQGDAACGWVAFIAATSGSTLARIPVEAAKTIFTTPETMIAGVFAPTGKAIQNDRGFRVSGSWQWGSGTQNADWVLGGCSILNAAGELLNEKAPTSMCLMPANAIEFADTWHVSGLQGTGSTDYGVNDLQINAEHVVGFAKHTPPAGPLFQFPHFTLLALGIAAVAMGIARAAMDELITLAESKKRVGTNSALATRPHTHIEVARAEATLRSARAFFYDAINIAWSEAIAGDKVSLAMRRDIRLATTHAVESSVKVVDAMYTLGAGSAVYYNSKLQQHFRDVHMTTQHIMVAPSTLELTGRLYLGVESNTATL
jgi:alkylation response protein AidB-like acyl-CoA dehydrogenase